MSSTDLQNDAGLGSDAAEDRRGGRGGGVALVGVLLDHDARVHLGPMVVLVLAPAEDHRQRSRQMG